MMNLTPEWQTERSRFNHDWLQNELINHLIALMALPEDTLNRQSIAINIKQWEEQISRIQNLIDSIEYDMSPARLFEQPPLSNLAECHKKWMIPLLHKYWCEKNNIHGIKEEMTAGVKKVKAAFSVFKEKFDSGNFSAEEVRSFAAVCQEYAGYLSKLRNLSVLP